MAYDDLLRAGDIRPSKPTPRDIAGMLGTANVRMRHIETSSPVPDICYELAYDVARAAAQAVMAADGPRRSAKAIRRGGALPERGRSVVRPARDRIASGR